MYGEVTLGVIVRNCLFSRGRTVVACADCGWITWTGYTTRGEVDEVMYFTKLCPLEDMRQLRVQKVIGVCWLACVRRQLTGRGRG